VIGSVTGGTIDDGKYVTGRQQSKSNVVGCRDGYALHPVASLEC
jgi:hypothetical protein